MVYDSLTSDTETLTKVKLNQVDRTKKQLQLAMKTIGNLDERLTDLEAMVQAALFKPVSYTHLTLPTNREV